MRKILVLGLILLVFCSGCKSVKEKYIENCVETEKSHSFCNYKYEIDVKNKDESICKDEKYKLNCYKAVAIIMKSPEICDRLAGDTKFECIKEIALYYDDTLYCDATILGYAENTLEYEYAMHFKADCYADYAIKNDDMSYCEKVDIGDSVFDCYTKFAILKKKSEICENIKTTSTYNKGWCYSKMAQFFDDIRLCEKAQKTKPYCYYYFATKLKKISLCNKIDESSNFREVCFEKLG